MQRSSPWAAGLTCSKSHHATRPRGGRRGAHTSHAALANCVTRSQASITCHEKRRRKNAQPRRRRQPARRGRRCPRGDHVVVRAGDAVVVPVFWPPGASLTGLGHAHSRRQHNPTTATAAHDRTRTEIARRGSGWRCTSGGHAALAGKLRLDRAGLCIVWITCPPTPTRCALRIGIV